MSAYLIDKCALRNVTLAVNRVKRSKMSRFFSKNIDDAINSVAVPLIGIIPEDSEVFKLAERGLAVLSRKKNHAGLAYYNISQRICGQYVPLSFR